MPSGLATAAREEATDSSAGAARHTPFGSAVLPEVYVTLTVPAGSVMASRPAAGRVSSSSPVRGEAARLAKPSPSSSMRCGASVSTASTPASASAWQSWAWPKCLGSGTLTMLPPSSARSVTTQARPLSAKSPKRRAPEVASQRASLVTSPRSVAADTAPRSSTIAGTSDRNRLNAWRMAEIFRCSRSGRGRRGIRAHSRA